MNTDPVIKLYLETAIKQIHLKCPKGFLQCSFHLFDQITVDLWQEITPILKNNMATAANTIEKQKHLFALFQIDPFSWTFDIYIYIYICCFFHCALFMTRNLRSLGVLVGILAHGPTYQIHHSIQLQRIKHLNKDMQQKSLEIWNLAWTIVQSFHWDEILTVYILRVTCGHILTSLVVSPWPVVLMKQRWSHFLTFLSNIPNSKSPCTSRLRNIANCWWVFSRIYASKRGDNVENYLTQIQLL